MTTQIKVVVVVGQGYVGLPLAMRSVEVGYEVVGFDTDARRVERLNASDSYVEDISSAEIATALQTGRYLATTDPAHLAGFDVALITVPTPLKEGIPDLSFIEAAGRSLATHLKLGAVVVLEVDYLPGYDRGATGESPARRVGAPCRRGFSPRLQP